MLFQINRMDLAETGGEEEEVVEEEEVGDERRSGCGSLRFTHRMGAGPPPCLHASRAGQLLGSVRRCFGPPICTIDQKRSREPGSSPGFSPGSSTSPETSSRTYSASTSSPCGRKRATAAALVSAGRRLRLPQRPVLLSGGGAVSAAAPAAARPPRRRENPAGAPLQMASSAARRGERSGGGGQACGGASVKSAVRGGCRLLHKKPLHISGERRGSVRPSVREEGRGCGDRLVRQQVGVIPESTQRASTAAEGGPLQNTLRHTGVHTQMQRPPLPPPPPPPPPAVVLRSSVVSGSASGSGR